MNPSSVASWSQSILEFGIDLAVKATALIAIVLIIQYAVVRRRAILGSAVGNAGLIGLLLLPLSSLCLPSTRLALLPAKMTASREPGASASTSFDNHSVPTDNTEPAPRFVSLDSQDVADAPRSRTRFVAGPANPARVVDAPAHAESISPPTVRLTIDWAWVTIGIYASITLVMIIRLLTSILAVARLQRYCFEVVDVKWIEPLEHWRQRLEIGRCVQMVWSQRVRIPMVLGWLRPTIVLPISLTEEKCGQHVDAVLLHELSHVRRDDYLWNIILRLVESLYWPHILVWVLGRTITALRERACDDLCIHEMGGCSSYRETLLTLASGINFRHGPALGLAMARPSKLGRRLAQIDRSTGHDRCVPGLPARMIITSLAVAMATIVGTIQLVRREAHAAVVVEPTAVAEAAIPKAAGRVFHLHVVAADTGEPVANAQVRLSIGLRREWPKIDALGNVHILHSTGPADTSFSVDVWSADRAMQRFNWGGDPAKPIPDGETIKLHQGEKLGGVIRDEDGHPISGAVVHIWSHNYKTKDPHELMFDLLATSGADGKWQTAGAPETTGELLGFYVVHHDYLSGRDYSQKEIIPKIANLRAGTAVTVMKKGVPIEGRVVSADGKPVAGARVLSASYKGALFSDLTEFTVTTDVDGHFRTGQVKSGDWFLVAMAKGHAPGDQQVKIGSAVQQVEIKLGRPRPFKGRVVDSGGKPIAGAFVNFDTWRGYRDLGAFFWTDAEGRFRWNDAPDDETKVNVMRQGYLDLILESTPPSSDEVTFTLFESHSIRGTIRDSVTKKRVDRASVEYGIVDPKTGEPATWTTMSHAGFSGMVYQGELHVNLPVAADLFKIRVQSPGFQTFVSRAFRRDERTILDYNISLVPGIAAGPRGKVIRPDGKPLVGARVYSTQLNEGFNISDNGINVRGMNGKGRDEVTSADGSFSIPQYGNLSAALIVSDDFYAIASKATLDQNLVVESKPYGEIEGRYMIGSQPAGNLDLELRGFTQNRSTEFCRVSFHRKTTTDQDGRFVFKKVIPIDGLRISRNESSDKPGRVWGLGMPVRLEPGQKITVTAGGRGRPIVGRVELPKGWTKAIDFTERSTATIETNRAITPYPLKMFRGKTSLENREWSEWSQRWYDSAEGREYEEQRVAMNVGLQPDGSFRIDDVLPGEYRLSVRVNEESPNHNISPFARIVHVFTVPPIAGGQSDEPLALGALQLQPRLVLKVGEPAPAFEVTTVDGKKLAVPGDFKGKVLLLDFGTMWDMQSRLQVPRLNEVHQKFGKDPRFTILSLLSAADNTEARKFIEEKGQQWDQAIIGSMSNPISSAYGVDDQKTPAAIVIGPDGKVLAKDLWYRAIGKAVGAALDKYPK